MNDCDQYIEMLQQEEKRKKTECVTHKINKNTE